MVSHCIKFLYVCVWLFFCTACKKTTTQKFETTSFFDVQSYVIQERQQVFNQNWFVQQPNGSKQQLDTGALQAMFNLLAEAHINKPAWVLLYKVDTFAQSIAYTAKEASLRTRYLQIGRDNKQNITWVIAMLKSNNPLYQSQYVFRYVPKSRFSMKGYQRLFYGKESRFDLDFNHVIVEKSEKTKG